MKKILLVLCFAIGSTLICGCNTVEGFGKDLEKLGGKISDKAG